MTKNKNKTNFLTNKLPMVQDSNGYTRQLKQWQSCLDSSHALLAAR